MSTQHKRQTDWKAFVTFVASQCSTGQTETKIAKALEGARIAWTGTVEALRLGDTQLARGGQIRMPKVVAKVDAHRRILAAFVAPAIPPHLEDAWQDVAVGDLLTFQAAIVARGPFPAMRITWQGSEGLPNHQLGTSTSYAASVNGSVALP